MAYKSITAGFAGKCKACKGLIAVGDPIVWESLHKSTYHPACKPVVVAPVVVSKAGKITPIVNAALAGLKTPKGHAGAIVSHTQKGKGILVLQAAGILPGSMARVCVTLEGALAGFAAMQAQGPVFCRPCPTQPRHGFVDSRVVKDLAGVQAIWAETMAADPKGELIVMPLIKADHNCIWRPGLLAVGPGHDGATAGHHSISVFLEEGYSSVWHGLATKAGVSPTAQAPFIESVSHSGIDTVVTQIRAGVLSAPTEPDRVPVAMTVGAVIVKDGSVKADPDAMLAWEVEAKTLIPGFHIVYDEGGNMADHWSVHAQLNNIAVVTTFKPYVGQQVPKMGVDLVPLEPQAILFGFLGGILTPSLRQDDSNTRRKRTRATVAAIMGAHHGMRMGGDAGVHLGASVAMFLRLGQAAVWGEARHAYSHCHGFVQAQAPMISPTKGKSRQQIFSLVLDDWTKGREGLRDVTRVFHGQWSAGMGGKAWAAIAHAIVRVDSALIDLVKIPSQINAKRLFGALVTGINLAHNAVGAGCFLNKFASGQWFDMAAALDPRAALMAGPIWYEASLAGIEDRMALLAQLETMERINVGYAAPKGNVIASNAKGSAMMAAAQSILELPPEPVVFEPEPDAHTGPVKIGSFVPTHLGGLLSGAMIPPGAVVSGAQVKFGNEVIHAQIQLTIEGSVGYVSGEVAVPSSKVERVAAALAGLPAAKSWSGSSVIYTVLTVTPQTIMAGTVVVLTLV